MASENGDQPDRAALIQGFGEACQMMFVAMAALEAAGIDMQSALRELPGSGEGRSLYDELPGTLKMML